MFNRLVWTVKGYGEEIWGWREMDKVERLQWMLGLEHLKWMLGLDSRRRGYMVREEMQREMIRAQLGAIRRA